MHGRRNHGARAADVIAARMAGNLQSILNQEPVVAGDDVTDEDITRELAMYNKGTNPTGQRW